MRFDDTSGLQIQNVDMRKETLGRIEGVRTEPVEGGFVCGVPMASLGFPEASYGLKCLHRSL